MLTNKSTLISSLFLIACSMSFAGVVDVTSPAFVATRIGCGEIISLRDSTQKPLPNDMVSSSYPGTTKTSKNENTTGGQVIQVLNSVPGVGIATAVVADIVVGSLVAASRDHSDEIIKRQEESTQEYQDVKAIEVKLDSGDVINIPAIVVSGMRMSVGRRVIAYYRKSTNSIQLSFPILFGSYNALEPGDSDYQSRCSRNADSTIVADVLRRSQKFVDESRIKDLKERRIVSSASK